MAKTVVYGYRLLTSVEPSGFLRHVRLLPVQLDL